MDMEPNFKRCGRPFNQVYRSWTSGRPYMEANLDKCGTP